MLITEMNGELVRVKARFGHAQWAMIPLIVSLVFSIGAWVWILKTMS
jgi:hypothetical protein